MNLGSFFSLNIKNNKSSKINIGDHMDISKKLRSYILEDEFQLNVFLDKVNIVNYSSIGHFDSNKVIVRYHGGSVNITGNNLVVSRLLNDEILITGSIKNIELR